MRDKLAPHLKEFVLCKGWIEDWKPVDENITQVYIKNPVIKEANKNVLFDDLNLIIENIVPKMMNTLLG